MRRCGLLPSRHLWIEARVPAAAAAAVIATAVVVGLSEAASGRIGRFDHLILQSMRSTQDPAIAVGPLWLPSIARDLTALGSHAVGFLLTLSAAVASALSGDSHAARRVTCAGVGAMVVTALLKAGFAHPRPDEIQALVSVASTSFPSGHALLAAALYPTLGTMLAARSPRSRDRSILVAGSLIIVGIVGATRVFLGVHNPSDVVAGWIVGLSWAMLCALITPPARALAGAEP